MKVVIMISTIAESARPRVKTPCDNIKSNTAKLPITYTYVWVLSECSV